MLRSLLARLYAVARPGRRLFVSELGGCSAVVVRSVVFGVVVYYAHVEYPVMHKGSPRVHRLNANNGLPFATRADADAWCAAACRFVQLAGGLGVPVAAFPPMRSSAFVPEHVPVV